MSILDDIALIPADPNLVVGTVSEVHVYSFYGDYLLGNHAAQYFTFEKTTNSLLVDVRTVFKDANIERGSYLITINLFKGIWGGFGDEKVIIREISPDRTELRLSVNKSLGSELQLFKAEVEGLTQNNILNNLVINFGYNRIQKITNVRFEGNTVYVKLYQPIDDEVEEKNKGWFGFEIIDPYVDTVVLSIPVKSADLFDVGAPNFTIDTTQYQSNATVFKSWNDVLDANLTTRQRIIEQSLSGSTNVVLPIDFTDFNNFIFYSSAEEQLRNFHYKIGKIEEYSSSIVTLQASTASNTTFISSSVDLNNRRIDQITSNFSPWERWLWFENTSSLFTHDITGSIKPWPKRIISGSWVNYSTSASISQTWYNNLLVSASAFDLQNNNRLYWSIPEHIYMDPGNSDFVTFVDMVGEHFDVLWTYITAMTRIHERDEHPERGAPNGVLYYIAKSFGWNLQNTRQLADLWNYKIGSNSSGSYASTGSMFSLSHENQTHQIWKRIVNNLPYLLKTKGTQRSVKALLSIYGIPQTLISIKEYGGPAKKKYNPVLIEDRFQYEANFTGSNYVELNRRLLLSDSGSWGGLTRVPDTIEFSVRTNYSSSTSMSLWAIENGSDRSQVLANLQLVHKLYLDGTSSYSGSDAYGKLKLEVTRWNQATGAPFAAVTGFSDYIPIFDGDRWTIKISTNTTFTQSQASTQRINVTASKASDCFEGRIVHSGSVTAAVTSGTINFTHAWGASTASFATPHIIVLGGTTGSSGFSGTSSRFVGQLSAYKEYFTALSDNTYNSHILNPAAYHDNVDTGSYYTLYRYYPLGIDQQRWDHSVYTAVSSSHPNRIASYDTTASFVNWTGSQSDQYISNNETYYINTPSIGGNLLRSNKIRLEDSILSRDLSPNSRSDIGTFDFDGFDTNRLAIVFSPTDQVNFDIYNHTGFTELDDYIGDPEYEYEDGYHELQRFAREYTKKYQQYYDVNGLIKVLALYDYTFFEQVKQLIPAKADALLGILIESDVLHRSKTRFTKRPIVENPQYDAEFPQYQPSASGEQPMYEGSASFFVTAEAKYRYITGSFSPLFYASGSTFSHLGTGSRGSVDMNLDAFPFRYSGSQCETQSYIDQYRLNCCFKKVNFHYSSSGTFAKEYEKKWYTAVSKSYEMYYSRSLECTSYQYANRECGKAFSSRFVGSKLEGAGININSPNTIDGGPVVTIWESNPNQLRLGDSPLGGNLFVE